ncbi:hypothetical protein YDYSY3_23310 [Paenibacillus chitinolyticus]|uniref:hypothetical protein n=1 Tax=Paenibacillus chitinolyticus TaxID=79263 RepID=UPI0026E4FC7C|nr:hypothetical protein [Paenibacillus chitinolyticus]GKS11331.1 hypothetical protein YDYSY3_23310 [Paenibacillus chitinolyticus]
MSLTRKFKVSITAFSLFLSMSVASINSAFASSTDVSSSAIAPAASLSKPWSLYGTDSTCQSCGYISSQGNITWTPLVSTAYSGWANTIWNGGYGDDVTVSTTVMLNTVYNNGLSVENYPLSNSVTKSGLNTIESPVNCNHSASGYGVVTARVEARGTISSPYFSYSYYGAGNHGL